MFLWPLSTLKCFKKHTTHLFEPGASHLIGPSVEAGHFGGTFEEAEASLSQLLSHAGTEGGQTAGQRRFGIFQGLWDRHTNTTQIVLEYKDLCPQIGF